MVKLDWYILKKFIVTFVFCMLLFTIMSVAVDASEKTDDFSRTGLGAWQILRQYYFGFVPFIWGLLFPIFVFIAVIFFTSRMAARSEIIAILASGTSYNRMLRPYLIGGLLFAMLLWFGNRYLIPRANEIKSTFQNAYFEKNNQSNDRFTGDCYKCFYRRIDQNTFIGMRSYDTASKSASTFFLQRVKGDRVIYNLRASSIRWDTATNKWKLLGVTERKVDSMKETIRQFTDTIINLNLKPDELRKDEFLKERLNTPELVDFIEREEMRGTEGLNTLKVERYRRTATSFSVLLLTFIGVIIASRKSRGGSGTHLALGIVIAAIFVVSDRFSTAFSMKGNLTPFLAAWLPNIVFTGIAYLMYRRAPK
jgi:lipopolysaccharide export system permease protein